MLFEHAGNFGFMKGSKCFFGYEKKIHNSQF